MRSEVKSAERPPHNRLFTTLTEWAEWSSAEWFSVKIRADLALPSYEGEWLGLAVDIAAVHYPDGLSS